MFCRETTRTRYRMCRYFTIEGRKVVVLAEQQFASVSIAEDRRRFRVCRVVFQHA